MVDQTLKPLETIKWIKMKMMKNSSKILIRKWLMRRKNRVKLIDSCKHNTPWNLMTERRMEDKLAFITRGISH
jgi:hypothetical protein